MPTYDDDDIPAPADPHLAVVDPDQLLWVLGQISDAARIPLGGPHWVGEVVGLIGDGRRLREMRRRWPEATGDLAVRLATVPHIDRPAS